MATVVHTLTVEGAQACIVSWTPVTNTNADGSVLELPTKPYRCVQVFGTFGGATLTMQGSNDPSLVNWFTLQDQAGNDVAFAAAGGAQIQILPRYIRPLLSGGAGSSLTVLLYAKHFRG